jgi:hypothetical protein
MWLNYVKAVGLMPGLHPIDVRKMCQGSNTMKVELQRINLSRQKDNWSFQLKMNQMNSSSQSKEIRLDIRMVIL